MEGFAWVAFVALWWIIGTVMKGIKESNKAAQNKQQLRRNRYRSPSPRRNLSPRP